MDNTDKAYVDNYPPLRDWLREINAVCNWQILQGREGGHHQYIECWSVNGRTFLISVRSHKHGWDIFTSGTSNEIPQTLEDANVRLGLKVPNG